MPHATGDYSFGSLDEDEAASRYFAENGDALDAAANGFLEKEIDQTDKDEGAVDYEDISEDDLPDEEEGGGTGHFDEVEGELPENPYGLNGDGYTNGYHDANDPVSDDLFGGDDTQDLFGEHTSSPEQVRHPQEDVKPVSSKRPAGLALPIGLALPGSNRPAQQQHQAKTRPQQAVSTSMSPPSYQNGGGSRSVSREVRSEQEDDDILDPLERQQRDMLRNAAKKARGEEVQEIVQKVEPDEFWDMFPGFDNNHNPRMLEMLPQRAVKYRGKLPLKPPRAVLPTKLALDVLPDQERSFKSVAAGRTVQDVTSERTLIYLRQGAEAEQDSDDDLALSSFDEDEMIGGTTMADLAIICEDWDVRSFDTLSQPDEGYEAEEERRSAKKRKVDILSSTNVMMPGMDQWPSFEEPERAAAKAARKVTLDLNDPSLLVDEQVPQTDRRAKRIPCDLRRDAALTRDLAMRYNISNDEAYDLLKENHQHKVRSTLGGMTIENALPATRLQFPFYKVALDPKTKRSFHRPALHLKDWEIKPQKEFRFTKLKTIKKKERRGREIKELFATAESLAFNDNSHMLMLEYSEEAPVMLSNFGMGNRLINFYRKRNADDQERPKREIGETQVLLTQDKSPFSNFGHVDQGEVVPTVQNQLFRAPVYQHTTRPTDFFVGVSSTHEYGSRMYLRNMENLHAVGQQLPTMEVPGEHSRRVTDAAKKRLRALAYRIYVKSQNPARRDKVLDNATLMRHLKGHDMPQTRSKMREFMKYERNARGEGGVWIPPSGSVVPDAETLRTWVKPEDICALDSMQVGVQRLNDLGLGSKDEEKEDIDENANIEELLAPWRSTKNFLQATQGKAMLKLHGEGDPTGRGEGFSFVKTSMKGGFQALGESVEDKIDAKRRRENGGHTYNVAKQQKAYDDYIRMIWERQKRSLSSNVEYSDEEMDDEPELEAADTYGRAATPRSSFAGTPMRRADDETGTQFSRASVDRAGGRVLIIRRTGGRDAYGQEADTIEKITNPKVIKEYVRRKNEKLLASVDIYNYISNGDPVMDALVKKAIEDEKTRIEKNVERRQARERAKGKGAGGAAGSPPASTAGSPGPSDVEASVANGATSSATATPQKGRGRNKDGTARKCANCGQQGHIKTNRKLCPLLNGTMKAKDARPNGDSSFGAAPAPLAL